MQLEKRLFASGFVLSALLAACGGGGGGGGCSGGVASCTVVAPPVVVTATNASGTVVDDTTGAPISGVNVVLYPWTAGSTTVIAQATTGATGAFTLSNVTNGHYLLVIGSNLATDTTYTTVHDNVTLAGGNQILVAPTLPSMPGYTAPVWETNGTYRISHIDASKELPCFQRFNADRAAASQPAVPLDEWVMENVRTNNANALSSQAISNKYVSTQDTSVASGIASCNTLTDAAFPPTAGAYANDSRIAWVGAQYVVTPTATYRGVLEAPFDPRGYSDPNFPNWP
jgi:hypothetical protein